MPNTTLSNSMHRVRNLAHVALALGLVASCASASSAIGLSTASSAHPPPVKLKSSAVIQAPIIDGRANDAVWNRAGSLQVMVREVSSGQERRRAQVVIRSVHTTAHVYFLVSWADPTHDASHKTWVWNPEQRAYDEGSDREDVVALAFEHTGAFNADMLSGAEAVWDIWHWKASRTDPSGYAMDKTHRYTKQNPSGKAKSFRARDGSRIWIARPEDAGDSPQKRQPAPTEHQGDRVAQYVASTPSGSAADVVAKGIWRDGRWTVEFARKLSTGHEDDTAFDPRRTYLMSVAVFDREEHVHHSPSGVIELAFEVPRPTAQD